jgi:serine/threonine-protein kinase
MLTSAPTPWAYNADTAAWGQNAYPTLVASSGSTKGDTTLTCTIADDQGNVLATKTSAAAFASVSCAVFPN